MYTVSVRRDFVAQHFLTVPDCGPENEWHSHHFEAEIRVCGPELGPHGYLVDITELEEALEAQVDRYGDATLNELPEFEGKNPSVEHFARFLAHRVLDRIPSDRLDSLTCRLWEDAQAWASYRRRLH